MKILGEQSRAKSWPITAHVCAEGGGASFMTRIFYGNAL